MKLWTIAGFEIRILIRLKVVVLNLFLLPLLLIFILGNALSPLNDSNADSTIDQVNVTLVKPAGEASINLGLDAFLQNPEISTVLNIQYGSSRETAEADLRSGATDFVLLVPENFETRVTEGMKIHWEYILGQDPMKNHVAEMVFDNYLDEVNRMQATAIVLGPGSAVKTMNSGTETAGSYVETASLNEKGKSYSAFQYYAASMLIMFLLYSGLMVNESLHSEIENRTLYRLHSMPVRPLDIFLGKIIGNGVITSLQAAVIILGTQWMYGVEWGSNPLYLFAICVLVVLCSMMLAVVISLLCKSATTAKTVLQIVIILMTFLSGGFQPIPLDLIQKLSQFTINHWALQGFLRIMLDSDPGEIIYHISMLGMVSGVLLLIGMISYRKVGYHE